MSLKTEIESSLNRASREGESGTPDFILSEYLMSCLRAYEAAVTQRDVLAEVASGQATRIESERTFVEYERPMTQSHSVLRGGARRNPA